MIKNISMVSIESYSDYYPNNPARANIIVTDREVSLTTSKTLFNLIQTTTLNSLDSSGMEYEELAEINGASAYVFLINRASLRFDNINIFWELSNSALGLDFTYTVHWFNQVITFTNMHFEMQGKIFQNNIATVNVFAENITMDMYKANGGFVYYSLCTYPGDLNLAELRYSNIKAYYSKPNPILYGLLVNMGNANLTISNLDMDVYSLAQNANIMVGVFPNPNWIPQDDAVQITEIDTFVDQLSDNPTGERISFVGHYAAFPMLRTHQVILKHGLFTNRENDQIPYAIFRGLYNIDVLVQNVTVSNSNFVFYAFVIRFANNVTISELHHDSIITSADSLINLENILHIDFKDFSLRNLTTSEFDMFWINVLGDSTRVYISNGLFEDIHLYQSPAIMFYELFLDIQMTNITIINVTVDTNTAIFEFSSPQAFSLSHLNFSEIKSHSEKSVNNYMIEIAHIDFTDAVKNFSISNIEISNSYVGFLSLFGSTGVPSEHQIQIDNVYVHDCDFIDTRDLFSFKNIIYATSFGISLSDHSFANINFKQGGNLYRFGQLLDSMIELDTARFANITAGQISIESFTAATRGQATKVRMSAVTTEAINARYGSFITINTGGQLTIMNSTLANIHCYEEGSVLNAGSERTTTVIRNSSFVNNTSVLGGVMYATSQSGILCYNWTFYHNFAIEGGIIATSDHGYFLFQNSQFFENYATSGLIANMYDSVVESSFISCYIYSNVFLSSMDILYDLTAEWSLLWFLKSDFKLYLLANQHLMKVVFSPSVAKAIISTLEVRNSFIFNQNQLIDGYSWFIAVANSSLSGSKVEYPVINFSISSVSISDTTISNMSSLQGKGNGLITGITDSKLMIAGLDYSDSDATLLLLRNVTGSIRGLTITRSFSALNMIQTSLCHGLSIEHSSISYVSSDQRSIVVFKNNGGLNLNNISFTDFPHTAIEVQGTELQSVLNISVVSWNQAFDISFNSSIKIQHSYFDNNGNSSVYFGGSIKSEDSNITVMSSTFSNNKARSGGSIALLCKSTEKWMFSLTSNRFVNNSATVKGGALFYNLYRPFLDANLFKGNSALYGPNIASYPVHIRLKGARDQLIMLNDVVSGQVISRILTLALFDHDEQVIVTDNSSKIKITAGHASSGIEGTTELAVKRGEASFDDIIFIAQPGTQHALYKVSSAAVDAEVIDLQYQGTLRKASMDVSFRFCQSGEFESSGRCIVWSPGTYALGANQTDCTSWMDDAMWLGGAQINVNSGYFRASHDSSKIVQCLRKEACKGGYLENQELPVECASGYTGILWAECQVTSNTKYEQTGNFRWSKWPSMEVNSIRIIGIMLVVLSFISILIVVNLRKRGESQKSTLMRIMTNYLQVISTALAYNIAYPDVVSDIALPAEAFGSSSQSFVSVDWFIQHNEMNVFAPSAAIFKIFLTSLMPFMMVGLYSLVWIVLFFVANKWWSEIKRNVIVSIVIVLFLLHPTLTRASLSIFQWVKIDSGDFRVRTALDLKWYSEEHLLWSFLLGVPSLLVWGIGIPVTALALLVKNRHRLDDSDIHKYFLMLYQGLKHDRYYWELVNTSRKALLLFVLSFLSTTNIEYRILTASFIMTVMLRLQQFLKPYKSEINNRLEYHEIATGTFTIFAGMIFEEERDLAAMSTIIFILMLLFNISFLFFWTYWMLNTEKHKYEFVRNAVKCWETIFRFSNESDQQNINDDAKNLRPRLQHLNKAQSLKVNKNHTHHSHQRELDSHGVSSRDRDAGSKNKLKHRLDDGYSILEESKHAYDMLNDKIEEMGSSASISSSRRVQFSSNKLLSNKRSSSGAHWKDSSVQYEDNSFHVSGIELYKDIEH